MKVVVVGLGILGRQIVAALERDGNDVTAIDIAAERADRVRPTMAGMVIEGDGCDPTVLERAGVQGSDAFVALIGTDEENLVASFVAKTRFGVPRVVARINDPKNAWLFDDTWGIDVAMSAPTILVSLVAEATSASPTVALMELATAGVRVVEARIDESSPLAGKAVGSLSLPDGLQIGTVIRDRNPVAPDDHLVLGAGDLLLVFAKTGIDVSGLSLR